MTTDNVECQVWDNQTGGYDFGIVLEKRSSIPVSDTYMFDEIGLM
jgi:hypothetical protein